MKFINNKKTTIKFINNNIKFTKEKKMKKNLPST